MTHVKVISRGIPTVRCYLPVNSIACCQFLPANLSNISSNSKLHLYARGKSNALPLLNLLLDQIQEHPRTTFADVKPIEVDSVLASQVANILKQDSCEINERTNDSVGNFKFDPHLSKNVFHYPIAKDIQQSQSSSKTFVTMTYAGKINDVLLNLSFFFKSFNRLIMCIVNILIVWCSDLVVTGLNTSNINYGMIWDCRGIAQNKSKFVQV